MRVLVVILILASVHGCGDRAETSVDAVDGAVSVDAGVEPAAVAQDSGDARVDAALRLVAAERYGEARELLRQVLDTWPHEGRALLYMAVAWQREKRYETAREYFRRVLRLGSTFSGRQRAFHFYGWCLLDLGELGGAREAFQKHLASASDAADSHFGIGRIDLEEGKLLEAAARFRRAIAIDAGKPWRGRQLGKAHLRLADVHLLRDETDRARAALLRAVELSPELHQAWYRLYRLYTRQGDAARAGAALKAWKRGREGGGMTR